MVWWLQHALVLLLLIACVAFVVRVLSRSLTSRGRSGCGTCGGCAVPPASSPSPRSAHKRIVFLPADSLRSKAGR